MLHNTDIRSRAKEQGVKFYEVAAYMGKSQAYLTRKLYFELDPATTQFVLKEKATGVIGTNDEDDKMLPDNIISIHRTSNQKELAEIYSSADLYFNPTREENYPTVNMESIACGTPVMTFKTGGSPEIIDDKTGVVVEDNIDDIEQKIISIYETGPFKLSDLEERAKTFSADDKFAEYLWLFAANG